MCKTCVSVSERLKEDQCASCNTGYALGANKTCQPYACFTGEGAACRTCEGQGKRTADNQCKSCNEGYYLTDDLTCQKSTCEVGEDSSCKTCGPDNKCSSCNAGFQLSDGSCEPITCDVGTGDACSLCAEQADRVRVNQCTACNTGYRLTRQGCEWFGERNGLGVGQSQRFHSVISFAKAITKHVNCLYRCRQSIAPPFPLNRWTSSGLFAWRRLGWARRHDGSPPACMLPARQNTCEVYVCTTGNGDACQGCLKVENRTRDNQCSSCNPGFRLQGTKCVPFTCASGLGPACALAGNSKNEFPFQTSHKQCPDKSNALGKTGFWLRSAAKRVSGFGFR